MKRRRGLSAEELDLWRRATKDVAPIAERAHVGLPEKPNASPPPVDTVRFRPPRPSQIFQAQQPDNAAARGPRDPFHAGDPKLDRRAGRGRLPIDAKLDLHGHTQASARRALEAFLIAAARRGDRCVIVVTGKGRPDAEGRGAGVLRARLRDWLREDPLRALIARASPAHRRHGGDGAVYVFLKTNS